MTSLHIKKPQGHCKQAEHSLACQNVKEGFQEEVTFTETHKRCIGLRENQDRIQLYQLREQPSQV